MSATLAIPGVTPEQYAAIQKAALADGITLTGTKGEVKAHGCDVIYGYSAPFRATAGTLIVTVKHAPPFCTGAALHKIHDLIEAAITAPGTPAEKSTP